MSTTKAIILAAGEGTRMKSQKPKVIHKIYDKIMIDYVIEAAKEAGADEICVVVGHKKEQVMEAVTHDVEFVVQEEQLGTGHAVMQAKDFIQGDGDVFVLFGDTPLIAGTTLSKLKKHHHKHNLAVTVLSTVVDKPDGYGRIIRDDHNVFIKSVEHKDATERERASKEINAGMYIFKEKELNEALQNLSNDNAQGEYYLPDTMTYLMGNGHDVDSMIVEDYTEILGVNSRVQLYEATTILKKRINYMHMENGVTLIDAEQTYISKDAIIEQDVTIYPGTILEGKCVIKKGAIIGPNAKIVESTIGEDTVIDQSTILESTIGNQTKVGPFAYVRPNSTIGNEIKIGDFVEIKNAVIGDGTKISHLTYVGDADVGKKVNFGCGTVVVNYDGKHKNRTTIEDGAFIGCNTNLVSPVKVKENAYTAAGSTITEDVPSKALGIARARQENKIGWVDKRK